MSYDLLNGMLQLASKNKVFPSFLLINVFKILIPELYDSKNPFVQVNIERALQDFLQLAARDSQRENVGAILGIATASMLLKQTPKAR
jgi:hypothetical protein